MPPRVLLEQVRPSDVAAQHVDRLVPRHLHHLKHRRPRFRGASEETRAQAVAAAGGRIEPGAHSVALHDLRRAEGRKRRGLQAAALQHWPEQRTRADLRHGEPRLHRLHRAQAVAARNGDLMPLPALVGLAPTNPDAQPIRDFAQILDLERHQLAAAERAGKSPTPAMPGRACLPACSDRAAASRTSAVAGLLRSGAVPMVRRMPRSIALTPSALVGGSSPASLWRCATAAARRPMVEALRPPWARSDRYAATRPGCAGSGEAPRAWHQAAKSAQSRA